MLLIQNSLIKDENYQLWMLIARTRHMLYAARRKELSKYGITPEESVNLFGITLLDKKASPANLAKMRGREAHTISYEVSRMERRGLIKKTRDDNHKNWITIQLTEEGREAYKHAMKHESINRILSHLPKKDKQHLKSILFALYDAAVEEVGLQKRTKSHAKVT